MIRVNNFAIHTVILYFTVLTDKPTLDQIYIAGGHLGGGGGAGNDGSDEGQRGRAGVAGRQAAASAATAAADVALEKRRLSAGGSVTPIFYNIIVSIIHEKNRGKLHKSIGRCLFPGNGCFFPGIDAVL